MGVYNGIHTTDDDEYYYCSRNDCACHGPGYHYDSSGNNYKYVRAGNNYVERTGYYNFADGGNLNN